MFKIKIPQLPLEVAEYLEKSKGYSLLGLLEDPQNLGTQEVRDWLRFSENQNLIGLAWITG